MGGGKSKTYIDVTYQQLYPDTNKLPINFNTKLISYKQQTKSNTATFKKLIFDKAKLTNVTFLKKFGFISDYNASLSYISKQNAELHIHNITKETDVNVLYNIPTKYIWGYFTIAWIDGGGWYWDLKRKVITTSNRCPGKCSGIEYSDTYFGAYKWQLIKEIKPTNKDILITDVRYIDYKAVNYLNTTYETKDENIQYVKHKYFNRAYYTIKYLSYKIDDKWYKPIISNNTIKNSYDSTNNVNKLYLVNVDDSDDTIDVEFPMDHSNVVAIGYTSAQDKKVHIFTDYYHNFIQEVEHLHFLTIPIKSNGKYVVQDDKALDNWLNSVGIALPDKSQLSQDSLKDMLLTLLSKYNNKDIDSVDSLMKIIYGVTTNKRNLTINTKAGSYKYYWTSEVRDNYTYSYRNLDVNGYHNYKILDSKVANMDLNIINSWNYNTTYNSSIFFKRDECKTSDDNIYMVPLEYLKAIPMKDFYNAFYPLLWNIMYSKETVKFKWYQTSLFQFVMLTIAVMTGQYQVILAMAATQALIALGVDPVVATVVVAIISLGASLYTSGVNTLTASGSTMLTDGQVVTTASANAMTTSSSVTFSQAMYQGVQNLGFTGSIGVGGQLFQAYSVIKTDQIQKDTEDIKEQVEKTQDKIEEYSNKINEILQNTFKYKVNLSEPDKFNLLYDTMLSDPVEVSYGLMMSPLVDAFQPLNEFDY